MQVTSVAQMCQHDVLDIQLRYLLKLQAHIHISFSQQFDKIWGSLLLLLIAMHMAGSDYLSYGYALVL